MSGSEGDLGAYQIHVDVARGIQQESDQSYSNDTISGANALVLTADGPGHKTATVAGTVMAPTGSNTDEDLFQLGRVSAGTWWS